MAMSSTPWLSPVAPYPDNKTSSSNISVMSTTLKALLIRKDLNLPQQAFLGAVPSVIPLIIHS